MATQLFFVNTTCPGIHLGTNNPTLVGVASGWETFILRTTRGGSVLSVSATPLTGPTAGIETLLSGRKHEFITLPLAADVTIAGTINCNVWCREAAATDNVGANVVLERINSSGVIVSEIGRSANTTEMAISATTNSLATFTITPTSTAMKKGDRIRARLFIDDAGGNMAGGTASFFGIAGSTAGANGDTFITFTETFTLQTTQPSGTVLLLTSAAGPAVGANTELEMWKTPGVAAVTATINTTTGWTAPLQWTASAGGTAIEWYTRPLAGFTLDGLVRLNLRATESNAAADASLRAELAVTNGDGSGAVVWGAASIVDSSTPGGASAALYGELATTSTPVRGWLSGAATAVTIGQRLRLRVFLDDTSVLPLVTGHTATMDYNGPSGGCSATVGFSFRRQ